MSTDGAPAPEQLPDPHVANLDVSAIGFSSRPKTKLQQLLSEISSHRLITESRHSVIFSKDRTEGK